MVEVPNPTASASFVTRMGSNDDPGRPGPQIEYIYIYIYIYLMIIIDNNNDDNNFTVVGGLDPKLKTKPQPTP